MNEFEVLVGRTDGSLTSVGLQWRDLQLLQKDLAWIGAERRQTVIDQLLTLCNQLRAAGFTIGGMEQLEQLVKR